MPLTKAESLLLSNDELLAHLLENDQKRIQLAEVLPFFPINGDSLRVERATRTDFGTESQLPVFDTVSVAVSEGKSKPTAAQEKKYELKQLVQDLIVADYAANCQSNVNSQVGVQMEAGTRRMLYMFWKSFTEGDESAGSGEQFNGLKKLASAPQTITVNDGTNFQLTLDDLLKLVALIKSNNGRPHVLYASRKGYNTIIKLFYDKGVEPVFDFIDVPDSNGGTRTRKILMVEGIPVYFDDFVLDTDTGLGTFTDASSIYAIVLGRGGLYGIVPASFGEKMIRVKEVLSASNANTTYRVYWPVGLCLEKDDALARLRFRPHSSV